MGSLADVNFLFALLYAGHAHTKAASDWLESQEEDERVLVCRVVQMGVLRLLTNPKAMRDEVLTPADAWAQWDRLGGDTRFERVDEPSRLESAWRSITMGRRFLVDTDTYLAAFALAGSHRLVTFDSGFRRFGELDVVLLDPGPTSSS
jgi:toxin-antitoxin system PIN domain toxin